MKILWFSNCRLSNNSTKASGTWLYTMADNLHDKVNLVNITEDRVKDVIREKYKNVEQYVIPFYPTLNNGLPKKKNISIIVDIVNKIQPDIIHVWGMEKYWGLLATNGYLKGSLLLEIQGIRQSCAEVFDAGMSLGDLIKSFRLKELLRPSISILGVKRKHYNWTRYEHEMLSYFKHINTQSDWVRNRIYPYVCNESKIYKTAISVRKDFLECEKWDIKKTEEATVFCITTSASSLRGFHNVIKAIALVKKKIPKVKLILAGDFEQKRLSWRKSGYVKYLENLIKKNRLQDNIQFVGRLDASQMVSYLQKSRIFVQSSYVESYSLALAEALCVGVPSIVSFAGAMPEISEGVCMYYSPNDYVVCASYIIELLENEEKSQHLSNVELALKKIRISGEEVAEIQMSIYNSIYQHKH